MRKLAKSGIILTAENTAAQVIDDTTAKQWSIVQTSAGLVNVIGPIQYGSVKRVIHQTPASERQSTVLIGGTTTAETIVAATRYRIEIWNPEADYEGKAQGPQIYAYTSPAVLSGTASTDRTNVYTALANKINAYAGNNCVAYGLAVADYTLGTSTGDAATNFVVGEVVTQETSGYTAQVAACTISSGTFAGDDAAGKIWLYNLSNSAWLTTAKTLTAAGTAAAVGDKTPATTNCVVTVTNATTLFYQGLVIVDDAGYFTSSKTRGGINRVGTTAGFSSTSAPTVLLAGRYHIGQGTNMLLERPVFDQTGQQLLAGNIEYNFVNGDVPVAGQFYNKTIIEVEAGDEDALTFEPTTSSRFYVVYFNDSSPTDYTTDFTAAVDAAAAK